MDDQNHNKDIIRQLTRAVDKLADAFHLTKNVFSDNQTRYEALAHEIRKDQKKEVKRQRRDAWLIAMISILGIGLSVIAASFWSYQQEKVSLQKTQIAQLYNQENLIQQKIDDRLIRRDKLIDAMTNVRAVRDEGQRRCKNNQESSEKVSLEYQKNSRLADFALASAFYKTTGVFNTEVRDKILLFGSLADVDKVGICAKGSATDNELQAVEIDANNLILNSIEKLEKEKEQIREQLQHTT
jgi:hypothetical protein